MCLTAEDYLNYQKIMAKIGVYEPLSLDDIDFLDDHKISHIHKSYQNLLDMMKKRSTCLPR